MGSMHWVLDREYSEELPDSSLLEKYRSLLLQLPDENIDILVKQLVNAHLEFYCKCGCHSFFVRHDEHTDLPKLPDRALYREIAYQTNYSEELNVMLFVGVDCTLTQVTVFYGMGNACAIPKDLEVTGIEGIWAAQ